MVALMQTLGKFQEHDATTDGLLKRMNDVKFVSALFLLNEVLRHLNTLSKVFQQNKIHYSAIQPSLECTKCMIANVKATMKPLAVLKEALETQYKALDLKLKSSQEQVLSNLSNSYTTALEENLDKHFTEVAPVFGAFSIFLTQPPYLQQVISTFMHMVLQVFKFLLDSSSLMKVRWSLSGKILST